MNTVTDVTLHFHNHKEIGQYFAASDNKSNKLKEIAANKDPLPARDTVDASDYPDDLPF